jgi:hypothetical protein
MYKIYTKYLRINSITLLKNDFLLLENKYE